MPDHSQIVTWAWAQQSVWSQAADRLRQSLFRVRTAALALTVATAVIATAAGAVDVSSAVGKALAWLAAGCSALVALTQTLARGEKMHEWMRARSAAEALKAEMYTYLAGVSPYRNADRESLLGNRIGAVLDEVADLMHTTAAVQPAAKPLPAVSNVNTYAGVRVRGQIQRYYRPGSDAMRRRAQRFRTAQAALAVVAALLSATAAIAGLNQATAWLPVITTIAAAVAAEAALRRYNALAIEYARAYLQLERLLRNRASQPDRSPEAEDTFVRDAERVISLQNEAWMARGLAAADQADIT